VSTGAATPIVTLKVAVADPPAFAAPRVTLLVPAVVGVPEITPVVVFTLRPAGSPLALKEDGMFVAVIW
jgi:hypothetical protein